MNILNLGHTPRLSSDEEDLLWESGVIGVHNPLLLLQAVFYNRKLLSQGWPGTTRAEIFTIH